MENSKIIIASGPVIVENNKVLLSDQGDTNFWKFCGGKVRDGEMLQETAARRAKEELGIEIKIANQEPFIIHTVKEIDGDKFDVILVHYLAERIGKVSPGEDIRKWDWVPIKNLGKEKLGPNIIPALKHFEFIK